MVWIGVGVGHKLEQMHDNIAVVVVAFGQPKLSLTKTKNWRRQRRTINFPAPVTVALVVLVVVFVLSVRQVTHIFFGATTRLDKG